MLITAVMFLALDGSRFTYVDTAAPEANKYSDLTKDNCDTGEKLLSRCKRMLVIQKAIDQEMERLHARSDKTEEEKRQSKYDLIVLARKQKRIVVEAESIARTQEAISPFCAVFWQIRKDAEEIRIRILAGDTGKDTQAIEQEIIEVLEEIIQAFEKPAR